MRKYFNQDWNRFWKWKNKKETTPLSAYQKSYGPSFSSSKSHDPPPYSTAPPPVEIMNGPLQ